MDACVTLHDAYAQFAIDARLMPVGLAVEDATGHTTRYATTRPHWVPGNVFVGLAWRRPAADQIHIGHSA